jgi:hypothetical protein
LTVFDLLGVVHNDPKDYDHWPMVTEIRIYLKKQQIIFYLNHEKRNSDNLDGGQISCTIIITNEIAKEHGFMDINEAMLERRPEELFIKKITSIKNTDEIND